MQIIGIIHRASGNETVGEMWHETKVFDSSEPIQNVIDWLWKVNKLDGDKDYLKFLSSEVVLTVEKE